MAESGMNAPATLKGDSLERRIIRVLETAPQASVPAGFAARVAGQLPRRAAVVLAPTRYGRRAAVACLIFLVVLMLAFARKATGSSPYWFSLEFVLCAQFALLTVWLAARGYMTADTF